jgi:hypothetical protein
MKCQVLEELEKDGFKGNILSIEQSVAEKGFKKVGLLIKL